MLERLTDIGKELSELMPMLDLSKVLFSEHGNMCLIGLSAVI